MGDEDARKISQQSRWLAAVACALVAATLVAYWPGLNNGFVNYDDRLYILGNSHVRLGLTRESIVWAFTTFHGANWFPLTWLSWMTDIELYGLDAAGFHRTSLFFHCINTVLLFVAFVRLTGRVGSSAFVAAVFAVHPIHVESVAWASARKDVVSAAFWMLALIAHAEASKRMDAGDWRGARGPRAGVALSLLLGLLAKPTLVVLPFVLILVDAWPLRRLRVAGGELSFQRSIHEKLPLFAISAVLACVTVASQSAGGAVQSLADIGLSARLENAAVSYMVYLAHALWPAHLSAYYPHPLDSLSFWQVGPAVLFGAAVTWGVCRAWRSWPHLAVGWFWFAGTLVPVIGIVQVGQAAMADRYMYLPLVGLSIIVAYSAEKLTSPNSLPSSSHSPSRNRAIEAAILVVAGLLLLAMTMATRNQVRHWKDSTALFEHALAATSANHVAHINIGVAHVNAQRYEQAEVHLRRALEIAPRSAIAHGVLGDALRGRSRPELAIAQYREALVLEPASSRWLAGLGGALLDAERGAEALDIYRRALERDPSAEMHGNLGLALLAVGTSPEAISQLERAVALKPNLASVRGNLGIALLESNQLEAAIAQLERALEVDPGLSLVHANLALALVQRSDFVAASESIARAIRLEPENAKFHTIAARSARGANRLEAAVLHYRTAIGLGERSIGNLNDLAWLLANDSESGAPSEAVALAQEAAASSRLPSAEILDTLAVAYASAGRWRDAIESAEQALALIEASGARGVFAKEIRERISIYRARESSRAGK
jgi:tetratricopeptide (TPR) repeat protein